MLTGKSLLEKVGLFYVTFTFNPNETEEMRGEPFLFKGYS
jgi:hypothetical protein